MPGWRQVDRIYRCDLWWWYTLLYERYLLPRKSGHWRYKEVP